MAIIDIPFIHGIQGVLRPKRNSSVYGVFDSVPVNIPEADGASLVARARGDFTLSQTGLESVSCPRMTVTEGLVEYLAYNGALWRPVFLRLRNGGADTLRVGQPGFLNAVWRECMDAGSGMAWCDRSALSLGDGIPRNGNDSPRFSSTLEPAVAARLRDVTWNDREERAALAVTDISDAFVVIGGTVHVRTLGPMWKLKGGALTVLPDGCQAGGRGCSDLLYLADEVELARSMRCEGDLPLRGSIDIMDPDAYRASVPAGSDIPLMQASIKIRRATFCSSSPPDLPDAVLQGLARMRQLFPRGDFAKVYDMEPVLDTLEGISKAFPIKAVAFDGRLTEIPDPVADFLRWRERRLEAEPGMEGWGQARLL